MVIPLVLIVIGLAWYSGKYFNIGFKQAPDIFHRIRSSGQLIALTDKNSLDYFIYHGEAMGYQYELLKSFASYLGVHLKIIASNDVSQLNYYLKLNIADVIALDLPVTHEGKKQVRFSQAFGETRMILVQRKPVAGNKKNRFIKKLEDFNEDTVYIQKNPFTVSLITREIQRTGADVVLIEDPVRNSEALVRLVSKGEIPFAIVNEDLAWLLQRIYSNIDVGLRIKDNTSYAWGVRPSSDSLLILMNDWIKGIKKNGKLKKAFSRYYKDQRITEFFRRDYFSVTSEKLSPFDPQIRKSGKLIHWDWRLLASLVYEESNFRTGLISSRNASGLMQLMPQTATLLGVDSASSIAQQLQAGVKYLKLLDKQLPDAITDPSQRIHFILASYNVGLGKVLAARKQAEKYGKDPNKWDGNVDYYLTNKSHKDPAPGEDMSEDLSPFGMEGGFVAKILDRYQHYRNNMPE